MAPFILVALTASILAAETDVQKPNVLFIFTDDQRADTIHALGNDTIITPNIDSLAERGFVFNNTYCFGSNSGAVCCSSRNMVPTIFLHLAESYQFFSQAL